MHNEKRLVEMDYCTFQGLQWAVVRCRVDRWAQETGRDRRTFTYPGGESGEQMAARVRSWVKASTQTLLYVQSTNKP